MEKLTGTHLYITNNTEQDKECLILFDVNDESRWKDTFLIHADKVGQIPILECGTVRFVLGSHEWRFDIEDLSLTYHIDIDSDDSVSIYAKRLSEE